MTNKIEPFKDAEEAEAALFPADTADDALSLPPSPKGCHRALATIRAQEALCNALDVANKDLHILAAKHEAEIARWRTEHEDYKLEVAKDNIALGIKNAELIAEIARLTAALAKVPCKFADIKRNCTVMGILRRDWCESCKARTAQPKEKSDVQE